MTAEGVAWACLSAGDRDYHSGYIQVPASEQLQALDELRSEHSLQGAALNLVLPPEQYQVFQTERPAVEESELASAVRWKLGDLLDYPVEEAIIDTFEFPEDASRGRGSLINAVCARKSLLQAQVDRVMEAGFRLRRIDVAELAMRNLMVPLDPEARGVALLLLREHNGLLVFCRGETLYMARRIEVGLSSLRDASSQEHTVQSLALELQRSMDYYESQLRQVPPRTIFIAGQPAALPLAGMLSTNVTAEVVDLDWSLITGGEAPDHRSCVALGGLLGDTGVSS